MPNVAQQFAACPVPDIKNPAGCTHTRFCHFSSRWKHPGDFVGSALVHNHELGAV